MKKHILTIAMVTFAFLALAHSQVAVSVPDVAVPPAWLTAIMAWLAAVPVAGPVVLSVAKWLGVISSVLTILVTAILAVLKVLQAVLPLVKLQDLAAKVAALEDSKALYWLKMLSMYNAQKAVDGSPK